VWPDAADDAVIVEDAPDVLGIRRQPTAVDRRAEDRNSDGFGNGLHGLRMIA
jgi:hypothetical protein